MRILNKIWGITLIALLVVLASPNKTLAQGEYVTDQVFYDELSPYGTWVYDPDYGNVWVPDVDQGFQPYGTNGYWALTSYGNTWVSDYEWGWAPFHYGRWRFDNYYGWTWIPGYEWAPAWVTWRQGGGYFGWAPLMPGLSIDVSFGGYNIPNNYWVFAPEAYITSPNIYDYYVPYNNRVTIINRTTYINNTYVYNNRRYYSGPRSVEIQRATGRPVRVYNVSNASRPAERGVRNNNVNIYRPTVNRSESARPSRVVDGAAYRKENPAQRIADRANGVNRSNAEKLARTARSEKPNTSVVRVNENKPESGVTPNREGTTRPNGNDSRVRQQNTDRANTNADDNSQRVQRNQQQRQQVEQQRQQADDQAGQVQRQQAGQRDDQQRQQRNQQRQQRQQVEQQKQQATQQVEQRRQQRQQVEQRQQQADQQRQQFEQQRQQQEQQRQQADQQRQQQEQQRQQADQQRQQQQRQQQDQQRQQQPQRQQQDQQRQQQPQRQQQDQPRQQQPQRQQVEPQRQPRSTSGNERGIRRD